jgi:hypothetical protein
MAYLKKPTSFYAQTSVKEFYLDVWEPIEIAPSSNDSLTKILRKYEKRPDLMSYDLYGTVSLFWVFAVRNPDLINDPIEDFVAGLEIYVPSRSSLQGM